MKRLRVFIAYVDQSKQERMNGARGQMPIPPAMPKRMARGQVRGAHHVEETNMDWEVILQENHVQKWKDMTLGMMQIEENKDQVHLQRMAMHPNAEMFLKRMMQ